MYQLWLLNVDFPRVMRKTPFLDWCGMNMLGLSQQNTIFDASRLKFCIDTVCFGWSLVKAKEHKPSSIYSKNQQWRKSRSIPTQIHIFTHDHFLAAMGMPFHGHTCMPSSNQLVVIVDHKSFEPGSQCPTNNDEQPLPTDDSLLVQQTMNIWWNVLLTSLLETFPARPRTISFIGKSSPALT